MIVLEGCQPEHKMVSNTMQINRLGNGDAASNIHVQNDPTLLRGSNGRNGNLGSGGIIANTSHDDEGHGDVSGTSTVTDGMAGKKYMGQHEDMTLQDMYNNEGDFDDEDDSDWDPLESYMSIVQWNCINCTMVNVDGAIYCHICGEHKESGILRHGFLASPLEEASSILNVSLERNAKPEVQLSLLTMAEQEALIDENFPLFSRKPKHESSKSAATVADNPSSDRHQLVKDASSSDPNTSSKTFADLGLSDWALQTCKELGMKKPTPVQQNCIPHILAGDDVLGLAQTGSGKTAAFALPILHRLAKDPYGVFCLLVTPTRELAYQLAEQFKALGSCLNLKCAVVVGGMDMITQSQALMRRPHVVIATPGRLKVLIEQSPDVPAVFSNTKFLVLDEADRVLDVGFEAELRVVFKCLPKNRQTLLFSATMTSNLQALLDVSANKAYFYAAYEGLQTVDTLKQQYVFVPDTVKDVYLYHILSQRMEDMGIRSAIIFVSRCRDCHRLSLLMEVLGLEVAALHSYKSQSSRLSALHKFKSGKVPVLLATDVASRGLDIPTVDLVINYNIPRDPRDYVHRVGRTARAGRGGLALSLIIQNEVDLIKEVEKDLGKELEKFECKEDDVLEDIKKVFDARHVAKMKMSDDGFEETEKARKTQKMKSLAEKGFLKKRKREKPTVNELVE